MLCGQIMCFFFPTTTIHQMLAAASKPIYTIERGAVMRLCVFCLSTNLVYFNIFVRTTRNVNTEINITFAHSHLLWRLNPFFFGRRGCDAQICTKSTVLIIVYANLQMTCPNNKTVLTIATHTGSSLSLVGHHHSVRRPSAGHMCRFCSATLTHSTHMTKTAMNEKNAPTVN